MKKQNPIRSTVTHVVQSTGGRRNKKQSPKTKFIEFFEDLENRGPFAPNSLFERFTKKVRKDMEEAGTWISGNDEDLEFVAEYVARLQEQYFNFRREKEFTDWEIFKIVNGRCVGFQNHYLQYRKLYLKIRIWGLRTKRFRLSKWPLTQYPLIFGRVKLFPINFSEQYSKGENTFCYDIRSFFFTPMFYVRKEFPKGNLSK